MNTLVDPGVRAMPHRHALLMIADFDDSFVVFDPRSKQVHLLEDVTAVVFDACDGATDHATLIADISAAFGQPLAVVDRQVATMLRSFAALGLLDGTEPEAEPPCIGCGQDDVHDDTVRGRRRIGRRRARRGA